MTQADPVAAAELTEHMRAMLIESEPDDVTGREGCGVRVRTGQQSATAHALKRRGLGWIEYGCGGISTIYWNRPAGLAVRAALLNEDRCP